MINNDNTSKENKNNNKRRKRRSSTLTIIFVGFLVVGVFLALMSMTEDTSEFGSLPHRVASTLKDVSGKYMYYDEPEAPQELDDIWVMYQNLDDADKNVYNIFIDLVENRTVEDYSNAIVISEAKMDELGEDHFWNVYYAMCYDHPEYFFLMSESSAIHCSSLSYDGYITYFFDMETAPSEADQIVAFEKASEDFMKDIDLSMSDEDIELAIHDKLIDLVTYDYDILESDLPENPDNDSEIIWDLGNTAYGALVCDSEGRRNHAVCSGYAFAFEYLMHKVGIPCSMVSGSAFCIPASSLDQDIHAWNVVNISGQWFEVDPTWNDNDYDLSEDYEFFSALKNDTEKYNNLRHHYYNLSTAEIKDLKASDDTLFNVDGYEPYNAVYDSSHVRFDHTTEGCEDIEIFLNSLVPIAE
ncbi:transglutaminase domain-containing protein [Butyrivibrio sp. VCD2006]|uniref:transglutaminase domain-containing protein n=1 Tax=Butyrivibrio sp. VCD2006 TaxID=1280664 RepID=UPI0012DEE8F7|nr:transglutaminase domain-containing protein [Butyrivibrio sp. VCD2006]